MSCSMYSIRYSSQNKPEELLALITHIFQATGAERDRHALLIPQVYSVFLLAEYTQFSISFNSVQSLLLHVSFIMSVFASSESVEI
jgi:hypothetical protein